MHNDNQTLLISNFVKNTYFHHCLKSYFIKSRQSSPICHISCDFITQRDTPSRRETAVYKFYTISIVTKRWSSLSSTNFHPPFISWLFLLFQTQMNFTSFFFYIFSFILFLSSQQHKTWDCTITIKRELYRTKTRRKNGDKWIVFGSHFDDYCCFWKNWIWINKICKSYHDSYYVAVTQSFSANHFWFLFDHMMIHLMYLQSHTVYSSLQKLGEESVWMLHMLLLLGRPTTKTIIYIYNSASIPEANWHKHKVSILTKFPKDRTVVCMHPL